MKILLGCLMAMLLTACSGNRVVNYDVGEKPDDFPVLKAVGYAVIDIQPGPSQSEKMLQAIRASKMDAYRELAEQLNGQPALLELLCQDSRSELRPWHGHVVAAALVGSDGGLARYRLVIEPWLALLDRRVDS